MSEQLERLTTLAQAVLDAAVTIIDATATPAPESQFLTPARPAFDCEFIAVQVGRLAEDTTSPLSITSTKLRKHFGNVILPTLIVYVVRCAPEMTGRSAPSDAAKTASAAMVQQDGWALWNGFRQVQDDLFDGCLGVYFDGGIPITESGGFLGWQFQMRPSIEGYDSE